MAVRRVRRIIRRIDPWTVLKVSLVFNAIAALIFILGTWVTWSLALRRGIPDRIVDIFESLTLTITIEGELYFRIVVLLAIIGAILMTAFMTLGAVLYNLIADLVGGVEIAVLEETYRPAATRTRMVPASIPSQAVSQTAAPPADPVTAEPWIDQPPAPEPEVPTEIPAAALEGTEEPTHDEDGSPEAKSDGEQPLDELDEPVADEDETPRVRAG